MYENLLLEALEALVEQGKIGLEIEIDGSDGAGYVAATAILTIGSQKLIARDFTYVSLGNSED